jgi:hypothetical protein
MEEVIISFEITNNGLKGKFKCHNNLSNLICVSQIQSNNSKFFENFITKDIKFAKLSGQITLDLDIKNHLKIKKLALSGKIAKAIVNDKSILPEFTAIENINFKASILSNKIQSELLAFIDQKSFLLKAEVPNFKSLRKPKEFSLHIFLEEILVKHLEKLWPKALEKKNILSWIKNNISSDTRLQNANIQMNFTKNLNNFLLDKLNANFAIKNSNINYSKNYPPVKNIEAKAYFTKSDMNIMIFKGEVLNSEITSGKIIIPSFKNKETNLHLDLKIKGLAEDLLRHVDYKNPFNKNLKSLYNGNSNTNLNISLDLSSDKITLKNSSIVIDSKTSNTKTKILKGNSSFVLENKKEEEKFSVELDTDSKLKPFAAIYKNNQINKISLNILLKNNKIYLSNIKTNDKDFFASAIVNTKTKNLENIDIFSKDLNFTSQNDNDKMAIFFHAPYFNPQYILPLKNFSSTKRGRISKYTIDTKIDKIPLKKNKQIENLLVQINCHKASCENGLIKFDEKGVEKVRIDIAKKSNQIYSTILGKFHDLSIISAFTDHDFKITQGSVDLSAILLYKNNYTIKGEVKETSHIHFKKNNNSKKQKFKKLKIEFSLQDQIIKIKKIIVSNNRVAFMAKGNIDLFKKSVDLEGLYTPVNIINKKMFDYLPILGKILSGSDGGGLFAVKYKYYKKDQNTAGVLTKNPLSLIALGILRNLFFWD